MSSLASLCSAARPQPAASSASCRSAERRHRQATAPSCEGPAPVTYRTAQSPRSARPPVFCCIPSCCIPSCCILYCCILYCCIPHGTAPLQHLAPPSCMHGVSEPARLAVGRFRNEEGGYASPMLAAPRYGHARYGHARYDRVRHDPARHDAACHAVTTRLHVRLRPMPPPRRSLPARRPDAERAPDPSRTNPPTCRVTDLK